MKIGIVGWGIEGQSVYHFFGPEHQYLIVNEEPRDDFPPVSDKIQVRYLQEERSPGITGNVRNLSYLQGIENCDKIVYSVTSIRNLRKYFGDDMTFWLKATTVQHIFFEECKSKNIIGVTGTKGKGTTVTLIHNILEAAGKKVFLGGNIGNSLLDFLHKVQPDDWVVMELSNFQLSHFPYSPHIGACLLVVPEHLDWHESFDDYVKSKQNIFKHQKPEDLAIYNALDDGSRQVASVAPGKKIGYEVPPVGGAPSLKEAAYVESDTVYFTGVPICKVQEIALPGRHNLENICAAISVVWDITGGNIPAIKGVLQSFKGLEHRLEFVRETGGVKYYDDSFGTGPETAIVALKAFPQPKIIVLGGHDKNVPFDSLADAVITDNVRQVIAIGETAPKIVELLKQRSFSAVTTGLVKMPDIVAFAQKAAHPGDVVLLSTACSSFGLFKDYKDRGDQFKSAVQSLV